MTTYDELHQQNHNIIELTNILDHLFGDRSLCDSGVTCELFYRYVDQVKDHLSTIDHNVHKQLLIHGDQVVRNTADRYLGASHQIKQLFSDYLKRWCKVKQRELVIKEYDAFKKDTDEMFEMVLNRIQDETEHLYPLIRKVSEQKKVA